MNQVTLMGRLAADPELRQTGGGIAVTSFTIAADRPFIKGAERQTDWIDIVAWRNTAEFICRYFQKGSPIIVEGSIQTRNREDKAGQKRKSVEVVAEKVEFVLTAKGEGGNRAQEADSYAFEANTYHAGNFAQGAENEFITVNDEDLPF